MVLNFHEIILAAKDVDEASAGLARLVVVAREQALRHERREATGETDEAGGVFRKRLEVGARFVVEALEVGVRDELQEVLVAGEVLREQAEVKDGLALVGAALAFEAGGFDEVEFAAKDRLEVFLPGLGVELDRAVEIAMVSEGDG